MGAPRLCGLLLMACWLAGCSSSGSIGGLTYKNVWQTSMDVLRRRGKLIKSDRKKGLLVLRHATYYPHQEVVEEHVSPNAPDPFHDRKTFVEVRLDPRDDQVGVLVYAWSEYRAFSRRFDTDHRPELQHAVFEELLIELRHQQQRKRVGEQLREARAGIQPIPGMLYVPAGPFARGDDGEHADEGPRRKVVLKAYYIDEHEVTVAQYRKFIQAGGYSKRAAWSEAGWVWRTTHGITAPKSWSNNLRDSLPVFGVSWFEAEAYARWAGKRLPTEAQWEKAARYVLPSRFPWGNVPIAEVNCLGQSIYGPVPVTEYPRNRSLIGCRQMSGNVAEWCRDWYDEEAYQQGSTDPQGPDEGRFKVLRGGSFFAPTDATRTTYRDRSRPGSRAVSFGFRCVKEVGP